MDASSLLNYKCTGNVKQRLLLLIWTWYFHIFSWLVDSFEKIYVLWTFKNLSFSDIKKMSTSYLQVEKYILHTNLELEKNRFLTCTFFSSLKKLHLEKLKFKYRLIGSESSWILTVCLVKPLKSFFSFLRPLCNLSLIYGNWVQCWCVILQVIGGLGKKHILWHPLIYIEATFHIFSIL